MVLASIATVIHSFIVVQVPVRCQAEINRPEINMNTSIFILILLVTVCSAARVPVLSPGKAESGNAPEEKLTRMLKAALPLWRKNREKLVKMFDETLWHREENDAKQESV